VARAELEDDLQNTDHASTNIKLACMLVLSDTLLVGPYLQIAAGENAGKVDTRLEGHVQLPYERNGQCGEKKVGRDVAHCINRDVSDLRSPSAFDFW
jgi:hypothetical protein